MSGTLSVDLSFANSLINTIGAKPSTGQFLLTYSQIAAIDLNGRHTANWTDDAGRTATAHNLIVTREPIKVHYSRKTSDKDSCFLVEVSDARWLCKNPTFSIAINKQYNVKAPGYQGQYYQSSTNSGTAWTWAGMVENIWNLMSSQLGTYPGLPITPNGTPEGYVFPGCSAWDALTEVLNRIGCAVRWNPSVSTSQYSIVQVGATDTSQDTILANAERRLIHDAEFQPVVLGKIPYGVRVFFHRQELDYGTERTTPRDTNQWQSNAVYSVDVVGPDSATAESGVYHPIWDDLPAIYNASGSLTNSSALNTRAQERSDDFYRMLRSVGGQRLYQAYSGVVLANPGSTIKETRWRLDGQAAIITEVIRHPFLEIDRYGMTQRVGNLNLNQPFFGPGKPVYSQVEQIVRIANGTPSGGVYDSTIEQLTAAPSTWTARESIYVVDLGGASSLSAGARYKGRLVGYHSSRPLYAINTANTSGMVPTGDYTITGNWVIEGNITIKSDTVILGDSTTSLTIDGDSITIGGDTVTIGDVGTDTIKIGTDSTVTLVTTIEGDTVTVGGDNVTVIGGDSVTIGDTTTDTLLIGTTSTVTLTTTVCGTTTNIGTCSSQTTTVNIGNLNITGGNTYLYTVNILNNLILTGDATLGSDTASVVTIIGLEEFGETTVTTTAPPGKLQIPALDGVTGPPEWTGVLGEIATDGFDIYINDGTDWNTVGGGSGSGGISKWVRFDVDESDFTAAATTETITLATLGQNVFVEDMVYRVTEIWDGGISLNPFGNILLEDGTTTLDEAGIDLSVLSGTRTGYWTPPVLMAYAADSVLKFKVTDSAENVANYTQGQISIWIKFTALTKP